MTGPLVPKRVTDADGTTHLQVNTTQLIGAIITAIVSIASAFGIGNFVAPNEVKNFVDETTVKQLIRESDEFLTPQEADQRAFDMMRETKQSEHVRDSETILKQHDERIKNNEMNMYELQQQAIDANGKLDQLLEKIPD